ncbi:MAG: Cys-tRNA(Pro) deacylase [Eubacterium sp.]|nr:Cys-tRNA(Pro) deacylase [Eubacterium sp.]
MGKKDDKTNVMRVLDKAKINYSFRKYEQNASLTGGEIARLLGEEPEKVFKTLVTVSKSKEHYVFMLPVEKELDLKKAARAAGEKNIEMIAQKELLSLTGYVHGGCSPIGMKKQFKTFIDESARQFDTIMFSAGKVGYQVEIATADAERLIPLCFADLAKQ